MLHHPLHAGGPWPIHDTAASKAMEREAQALLAPHTLMDRAGLALAKLALALRPTQGSIGVLCGPGNNGGDGLLAAARLHQAGVPVCAYLVAGKRAPPFDAQWALHQAQQSGVPIQPQLPNAETSHRLWIDALLGLGLTRAPEGPIAEGVKFLQQQSTPILAVDLPSGLCSDTGTPFSGLVVQASHTLCLLSLKPGLFTGQGRSLCGDIWFDDLAVANPTPAGATLTGSSLLDAWRDRSRGSHHSAHKGSRGDVLIVGGAPGMRGAARLASRAALASGAGRVYTCLLDAQEEPVDPGRPELMCWPESRLLLTDRHIAQGIKQDLTLVVGCGAGALAPVHLAMLLDASGQMVLDADGLNAVASDARLQLALQARASKGQHTILTPHPLEAARLLGTSSQAVQADRLGAARELTKRFRCLVVLKGSGSLIAAPDLPLMINSSGNAALASPGTGDVLAGWLGGLWAQAHAPSHPEHEPASWRALQQLAATAVFWHGWAAQEQALGPLRAADLIEHMHAWHKRKLPC